MIVNNTPIEQYTVKGRVIHVKREDMCVEPPGPPFSKCRGLYEHMVNLKKQGFDTVGYAESAISMAGWGVAYFAKMLDMKAVIYDPQYRRETPRLLELHRQEWAKYDPVIVGVPAGRTKVNFHIAKKHLWKQYGFKSVMIPIGLRVPETVDATGEEWVRTMKTFSPDVTVVPVGSGTIFSGIIKYAKENDGKLIGVMCYTGSIGRKSKSVFSKAGKSPLSLMPPAVNVRFVDPGWEYTEYATTQCPFPCNEYYDLKAWDWLVNNLDSLKGNILFWNIGKGLENFAVK